MIAPVCFLVLGNWNGLGWIVNPSVEDLEGRCGKVRLVNESSLAGIKKVFLPVLGALGEFPLVDFEGGLVLSDDELNDFIEVGPVNHISTGLLDGGQAA